ncbi:hypothetical protein FGB62_243g06 [Gracilaria domingensis]|nr:hypothetical protein FGB62_243g06 [Gracilaria domingensis]
MRQSGRKLDDSHDWQLKRRQLGHCVLCRHRVLVPDRQIGEPDRNGGYGQALQRHRSVRDERSPRRHFLLQHAGEQGRHHAHGAHKRVDAAQGAHRRAHHVGAAGAALRRSDSHGRRGAAAATAGDDAHHVRVRARRAAGHRGARRGAGGSRGRVERVVGAAPAGAGAQTALVLRRQRPAALGKVRAPRRRGRRRAAAAARRRRRRVPRARRRLRVRVSRQC